MRSFVAIFLNAALRRELSKVARELGAGPADVKWVEEANFHLSLQFLGEVPASQVLAIESSLREVGREVQEFTLEVRGVGCFPPRGRPRVLWAGIGGQTPTPPVAAPSEDENKAGSGVHLDLELAQQVPTRNPPPTSHLSPLFSGQVAELTLLADRVARSLEPLGLQPDHPFSPHITLGRVRSDRGWRGLSVQLPNYREHYFGHQEVKSFALVESILTRSGPVYRQIASFVLDAVPQDNL